MMKLNRTKAAAFTALVVALAAGSVVLDNRVKVEAAGTQAPLFEVDPLWPQPLPNHWLMGATIGVSVDSRDHIWVIHRGASLEPKEQYAAQNPPAADCCKPAPPVLEFDAAGKLVGNWGGEGSGFDWPVSNHGITADHKGNIW